MAVYTEVAEEELAAFVARYDIGSVLAVKGIAEGVENSNFLLHTERGFYILTLYEKRVREEDLPFFIGLMRHLAQGKSPLEAGLGWAVKLRKNTDFLGRRALEEAHGKAPQKRFAGFTVDDPEIVLLGRETILRDGKPVGYLTSGGYGYTVGKSIGYGYVRGEDGASNEYLAAGEYELVVAMERIPARIHLEPLYDPTGEKVKA